MQKRINLGSLLLLVMLILPNLTMAADTNIELNANGDDVEGRIDVRVSPYETPLLIGGGFVYSDDKEEYWLANLSLAVKDEVFTPALSLGVGLKGVYGKTDYGSFDRTTSALAFQFLGDYDLRKTSVNIPVSFSGSVSYAPEVLSFDDTEKYFDFYAYGYFHINYFAALFVGYRDFEIDYKAGGRRDDLSDDAFYFGVRLSF